jgi:hypothetical protein
MNNPPKSIGTLHDELTKIQQQIDSIHSVLESIHQLMLSRAPEEKEKWEPTAYEYKTQPLGEVK